MSFSFLGYTHAFTSPNATPEQDWCATLVTALDAYSLDEFVESQTLEIMRAAFDKTTELQNADLKTLLCIFWLHDVVFENAQNGRVGLTRKDLCDALDAALAPNRLNLASETDQPSQTPSVTSQDVLNWFERECQNARSPFVRTLSRNALYQADLNELEKMLPEHFNDTTVCLARIEETNAVYLPRHVALQMKLFDQIKRRIECIDLQQLQYQALSSTITFAPNSPDEHELNTFQQEAVLKALSQPITVISGGPGTGKTSIIKRILKEAHDQGVIAGYDEVCLTAPTGKAAQRMLESLITSESGTLETRYPRLAEPCTIHRLLHISRNQQVKFSEKMPLQKKLIIVDEISMIALSLGCKLLDAIPLDSHLILIGDPDQLPPVEPGSLLQNLAAAPARARDFGEENFKKLKLCHVKLLQNYRAKEQPLIFGTQNAVIGGGYSPQTPENGQDKDYTIDKILHDQHRNAQQIAFNGFEWLTDPRETHHVLDRWIKCLRAVNVPQHASPVRHQAEAERCKAVQQALRSRCFWCNNIQQIDQHALRCVFKHFERYKLLTPKNTGLFGARQYNTYLRRHLFDTSYEMPAGMLVMLTSNNYDIDRFNGDTGIIVCEQRATELRKYVAFPHSNDVSNTSFDFFPLILLQDQLIEAFAITVHKSQGSQYEHVLIALPPHGPRSLMNRNLLYTAISRASQSATLIGDVNAVNECVTNAIIGDPYL